MSLIYSICISFAKKKVYLFVKFVGSHEDYNKIDVCSVEMFKK